MEYMTIIDAQYMFFNSSHRLKLVSISSFLDFHHQTCAINGIKNAMCSFLCNVENAYIITSNSVVDLISGDGLNRLGK